MKIENLELEEFIRYYIAYEFCLFMKRMDYKITFP